MGDRLRVLVASSDGAAAGWLSAALGDGYDVGAASRPESVLSSLDVGRTHVMVLGAGSAQTLARLREADSASVPILVVDTDDDPAPDIFYVLDRRMEPSDVRALIDAAAGRRVPSQAAPAGISSRDEAANVQRIMELARPLALQKNLRGAAGVVIGATEALLDADRAYCLFYDADDGSLWSEDENPVQTTAARGIFRRRRRSRRRVLRRRR